MGWSRQEVLDVARSTGERVVEAWSDHNAGQMGTVVGPMLHHTGSAWSWPRLTAPTLRTVREGRPDLRNSLCMYYIDYAGTIYCISEKISWHAGGGEWSGVTDGNGHYAGIEAESDGRQWTEATLRSYKKLAAAILRKARRGIEFAPRHAEYALPRGRKQDFSGYDSKAFVKDVAQLLANPNATEDDDMFEDNDRKDLQYLKVTVAAVLDARPDAPLSNSNGEMMKRVRDIHGLVAGQSAALTALSKLVAEQNGLSLDDVRRVVSEEIAKGVDVDVTVQGGSAA